MHLPHLTALSLAGWVLSASLSISYALAASQPTNKNEPLTSSLARMNYYRAMVGADPVEEFNPTADDATNHSRYVVLNRIQPGDVTILDDHLKGAGKYAPELHSEDPKLPGYSSGGASIAPRAVVAEADRIPNSGTDFVDRLMTNPFNAMLILDPELRYLVYGQYCGSGLCAVTFQMRQGLMQLRFRSLYRHSSSEMEQESYWKRGTRPLYFRKPIEFPAEGSSISLRTYNEQLSVNPLAPCAGYGTPSGLPIFLALGRHGRQDAHLLTSHSLLEDGNPIDHCGYDGSSYTNTDASIQTGARNGMSYYMVAVIVPRAPLKRSATYQVSMTVDSTDYTWSFKIAAGSP